MSFSNLLSDLRGQDFTVALLEGRLAVKPKERLTDELRFAIREHKVALLLELEFEENETKIKTMLREVSKNEAAWLELEAQIEERAAIMEFDGLIDHDEANTRAELLTLLTWVDDYKN
jgi:hypothetical protein